MCKLASLTSPCAADGGHVERATDGRQAAVGIPLRSVVPQVPAQVQVGEPDRGDRSVPSALHHQHLSLQPAVRELCSEADIDSSCDLSCDSEPTCCGPPFATLALADLQLVPVAAAYQNAVREQRLAAEISAATRERDFYLSRVDKAKGIAAIKERKARQQEASQGQGEQSGAPAQEAAPEAARMAVPLRMYGQRKAKADPVSGADAPLLSADVLAMVGSRK